MTDSWFITEKEATIVFKKKTKKRSILTSPLEAAGTGEDQRRTKQSELFGRVVGSHALPPKKKPHRI